VKLNILFSLVIILFITTSCKNSEENKATTLSETEMNSMQTDLNSMLENDTSEIIVLLKNIRKKITNNTDITWSSFDDVEELQTMMDKDIVEFEAGNFSSLKEYKIMFLPTGDFQEMAISNGWGEEYLQLASEFDELYQNMKANHIIE
jgi:hypothetical protein